jgi:hypothetical protein
MDCFVKGWKMFRATPEVFASLSLKHMATLESFSNLCCKIITFTSNDCG